MAESIAPNYRQSVTRRDATDSLSIVEEFFEAQLFIDFIDISVCHFENLDGRLIHVEGSDEILGIVHNQRPYATKPIDEPFSSQRHLSHLQLLHREQLQNDSTQL